MNADNPGVTRGEIYQSPRTLQLLGEDLDPLNAAVEAEDKDGKDNQKGQISSQFKAKVIFHGAETAIGDLGDDEQKTDRVTCRMHMDHSTIGGPVSISGSRHVSENPQLHQERKIKKKLCASGASV